jgi:glycosyltransferase involved in cell wall biosynthesis
MRILYICEEYPPGKSGGIGTMVQCLGRELVRQGHEVYVVGLYLPGYGQANYEEDHGVKVWRLRYLTDIGIFKNDFSARDKFTWKAMKATGLLHLDTKISSRKLFRFIRDLVSEDKIDIIEIQDWNTIFQNSFTPIKIPPFNAPLTVKFNGSHSYFAKETGARIRKYVYRSEKLLMESADMLSSVSSYTAEKTAELFQLGNKPIKILYNSIEIPRATDPVPNENVVIFSGSLIHKKGIFSLLKAWNFVARKNRVARLKIFGKGSIEQLKRSLSGEALPSVLFQGHVPRERLFNEFAGATAAVFPSYSECFAFAPLEAMAVGCAVINTSRASGKELVDNNVDGLLVDPDKPEEIADAILMMLENKRQRDRMAVAGQKLVQEKFNIARSVNEHIQYYQQVIRQYYLQHSTQLNQKP